MLLCEGPTRQVLLRGPSSWPSPWHIILYIPPENYARIGSLSYNGKDVILHPICKQRKIRPIYRSSLLHLVISRAPRGPPVPNNVFHTRHLHGTWNSSTSFILALQGCQALLLRASRCTPEVKGPELTRSLLAQESTACRGQDAEKGEMCVWEGEFQIPVPMSQLCSCKPQPGGKGTATAPGACVIWGYTHSRAVKGRGPRGSDPPSWEPGQGQHGLYGSPDWCEPQCPQRLRIC